MSNRFAAAMVAMLLALGWISVAGAGNGVIPAGTLGSDPHRAGLVIEHEDGALTYALVWFSEPDISGIELLERSGVDRLTIPFGSLGEAVCQLEGQGCDVAQCRRVLCQTGGADAPYWRAFRQVAPGDWDALDFGASSSRVQDGDIFAWSWSVGETTLPDLTLSDIAVRSGAVDVQTVDTVAGSVPTAALQSGVSDGSKQVIEPQSVMAGIAAIVVVAAVGGLLVVRQRRPSGAGV